MITSSSVTVLMTVYNGGKYLRSSVKSVLNQTFKDFEFLIINDCSTDSSVETIKSFHDQRIIVYSNEENLGQTRSLNIGLKLARGKYIARMDADDIAFPMWLEKLLNYASKHPGYAAIGSVAIVIDDVGRMKKILRTPTSFSGVIFSSFFGNALNHVGSFIKKEIILKEGGYNSEFKITQDYELWSSLIRNNYRLVNIPNILVAVRVHENSLGFVEEKKKGIQEVAETIYRNVNALASFNISYDDAVKLRIFYRFPEQLSSEEFNWANSLYERILCSLRDGFKLNPRVLKGMIRRQMLVPYCKRAISEVKNNRPKAAREITSSYQSAYGFHIILFLVFVVSFLSKKVAEKIVKVYDKLQEILLRAHMRGS